MDKRIVDLSGQKFGYWLVLSYAQRRKTDTLFWCRCVCGVVKPVIAMSLKKGSSKSCGCKSREIASQKMIKHGMASTPTYKSWHAMIQRTQGKGGHQSYVERGINVCDEWLSFDRFFADMGVRPKNCTLDRIDNSKGYFLENCRWADHLTQANNKDTNRREIVDGELMTVAQAARKYCIGISCVRHRLRKGWTLQNAVQVPARKAK